MSAATIISSPAPNFGPKSSGSSLSIRQLALRPFHLMLGHNNYPYADRVRFHGVKSERFYGLGFSYKNRFFALVKTR